MPEGFGHMADKAHVDGAMGRREYIGPYSGACELPALTPTGPCEAHAGLKERYGVQLDPQQERAAQVVDGATLLLAVPGSCKTTTMVARLGYLTLGRGVDPRSIIAVTYGTKAAEEMRQRFARQFAFDSQEIVKNITFCTINALSLRIYQEWCRKKPQSRRKRETIREKDAKRLLGDVYRGFKGEYVSERAHGLGDEGLVDKEQHAGPTRVPMAG